VTEAPAPRRLARRALRDRRSGWVGPVGVVLAALALAACGSAASHPGNRPPKAPGQGTQAATRQGTPGVTSSGGRGATSAVSGSSSGDGRSASSGSGGVPSALGSVGTSASSGTPTCQTAELAGRLVGVQGGGGLLEATIALVDTGGQPCGLKGYPGLQFLGSDQSVLSATVVPGGSVPFEAPAPTAVVLAPGASVEFNIGLPDSPAAGATTCPSASALRVEPPGDVAALSIPSDLQVCSSGPVHVSALFSPSSPEAATAVPGS
jgi:hypothetical protein